MAKVLLISKATASYFARFAKQITAGMKQRGYSAEIDPQTETKEGFLNAIEETLQEIKAENPKYNTAEALKRFNAFKDKPYFSIVWGNPGGLYYIANKGEFYENPYLQEIDPDTQAEAFQFIAFTGVNEILSEETAETVRKLLGLEDYSYIPMAFRLAIQVVAGISQYAENEKEPGAEDINYLLSRIGNATQKITESGRMLATAKTDKITGKTTNKNKDYIVTVLPSLINPRSGAEIKIKGYRPSTYKTLLFIQDQMTKNIYDNKSNMIRFSLDDYMNVMGAPENTRAYVRRVLREDLNTLRATEFIFGDTQISIIGSRSIHNNTVDITIDTVFFNLFYSYPSLNYYHRGIFKINDQIYPNAVALGVKLSNLYNIEPTRPVSVRSLLEICPRINTESALKRRMYNEIIDPLERDLDALCESCNGGFWWHYCKSNGEKYSDSELETLTPKSKVDSLILYGWENRPFIEKADRRNKLKKGK